MAKRSPIKYFQKNKVKLLLLIGILVIIGVVTFSFRKVYPDSSSQTPTAESNPGSSTEEIKSQNCTGDRITDKQAGFSITCPSNLKVFTSRVEYNQYIEKYEKIIFFCENQVIPKPNEGYIFCPGGGVKVWANGDGWGGGCSPEYLSIIILDGQSGSYCLYPTGFGQMYAGDIHSENNGSRFNITGTFSQSFTKDDALKMLSSFKVL